MHRILTLRPTRAIATRVMLAGGLMAQLLVGCSRTQAEPPMVVVPGPFVRAPFEETPQPGEPVEAYPDAPERIELDFWVWRGRGSRVTLMRDGSKTEATSHARMEIDEKARPEHRFTGVVALSGPTFEAFLAKVEPADLKAYAKPCEGPEGAWRDGAIYGLTVKRRGEAAETLNIHVGCASPEFREVVGALQTAGRLSEVARAAEPLIRNGR